MTMRTATSISSLTSSVAERRVCKKSDHNRRSGNYLVPTVAGDMARMQLGIRYTF